MGTEIKYNIKEKAVIFSLSVAVGCIIVVLALFLAASVCLAIDMSDNYSTLVSGLCLGVGSAVSGFLSSKKIKSGGIINGMVCGALMYFFVFMFSLFFSENGFSVVGLSHVLISLISASVGGVLGVNSTPKKKII